MSETPEPHPHGLVETLAVPGMVGIGALVTLQSRINGELAGRLGDGLRAGALAAMISFASGLLVLAVLVATRRPVRDGVRAIAAAARSGALRPWQLVGGAAGALLVASQGITVGTIGVAVFVVAVVGGQTTSGLAVDHAGLGPSGPRAVSPGRVVGALLTVVAVALSVSDRLGGSAALGGAGLALALLPLLAGAGTAWQQAVNGRVSAVGGPMGAAFNNFVVGTAVLLLLLAVSLLVPGHLDGLPHAPGDAWLYAGGVIGVVFISLAARLVRVHGVLVLGLCTVVGQVVAAVLLELLLGEHVGAATVLGAAVALVGVGVGALAGRTPRDARLAS